VESILLVSAIYFFWYPSSFPATDASSGIERDEWLWLAFISLPLILAGLVYVTLDWRVLLRQAWVVGLIGLSSIVYLIFVRQFLLANPPSTAIDRADYIFLLAALAPILLIQWFLNRHAFLLFPLTIWLVIFLILGIISVQFAPYESRGLRMLARPALGMALTVYCVELARTTRRMTTVLGIMVGLSFLVGVVALGATQWTVKSADFRGIITRLPELEPFFARGGFNPNEIAGALAWLTPLTGGLALYGWSRSSHLGQVFSFGAFFFLIVALTLGQSRFAIIGVLIVLTGIATLGASSTLRRIALGGVGLLIIVQAAILFNLLPAASSVGNGSGTSGDVGISRRDERTVNQRFAIWESAFAMVKDHPFTGVGMDRFRYPPVREDYPIKNYDLSPPHAHNEFVQIATDLGLPGLIVFAGWTIATAYMAFFIWQEGDQNARIVALSAGGGIIAHLLYGMGDAIPLWDRLSFIYWIMIGTIAAQYFLIKYRPL
jgi:O-antigen ligase